MADQPLTRRQIAGFQRGRSRVAQWRAELSLNQRRTDDAGQALGDRPPVELGGDLAGGHADASVRREVRRQDPVEDGLDLVAERIRGRSHAIGHQPDIGEQPHRQVVGRRPLADEWLDPERILAAGDAKVVGEVVDDRAVGDEHLGVRPQLQLLLHLRHQHPKLGLGAGLLVQTEGVEADHLAPDFDRSPCATDGGGEGMHGVRLAHGVRADERDLRAARPGHSPTAYRQAPVSTGAVEPMNGPMDSRASSAPMA